MKYYKIVGDLAQVREYANDPNNRCQIIEDGDSYSLTVLADISYSGEGQLIDLYASAESALGSSIQPWVPEEDL